MNQVKEVPRSYWLLWWKVGWHMALRHFAQAFLIMIIIVLGTSILGLIPLLGSPLSAALTVLLSAGGWKMTEAWYQVRTPRFETLFLAFRDKELIQRLIPLIVINVFAAAAGATIMDEDSIMTANPLAIAIPFAFLLTVQILMLAFALPLMVLRNMTLAETIPVSFEACVKNWVPLLWNTLLVLGVTLLAMLPLGLGLILILPVIICMSYAIYVTIFEGSDLEEAHRRLTAPPESRGPASQGPVPPTNP